MAFRLIWKLWVAIYTLQEKSMQDESATAECLSQLISALGHLKCEIWYSVGDESLVSDILKRAKAPVVLNAVEKPRIQGMETRIRNDLIVVLADFDVEKVLKEMLWGRDTKFFVVGNSIENIKRDFVKFWKYRVVNVFGILNHEDCVAVYGFLPYEKGGCGLSEPFVVDRFIQGNFTNGGKEFQHSMRIQNLNGCRANITVVDVKPNVMFEDELGTNATTHVQGIEGKLMTEIAKVLNFNATFLIALDGIGWGWIRPSPHGAVGEVFTGRSDFAIGLLAPTIERYESLDLSLPYNGEECITYGVPTGAGASTPNWITILLFEFTTVTWVLILLSSVIAFYGFKLVNTFSRVVIFRQRTELILFIFSSCLGLPVKTVSLLSFRLSLTFWILFSFIVTVAYKSSMGSKLTVPNRDPDINTFDELLESNLELTGYNNMLRLMQYNDSEPNIKKMVNRFKVTNFDIDYAVELIASQRKIAYVRHTSTFLYYALINPKAKGHIHVIKDCIMLYHPIVVTKKHSPFTNRLNQLISRLMESGITKRWRREYIYNVPPPPKPFLKLNKDHMYGVFCILCCGYFLGLVAFMAELVCFYSSNRSMGLCEVLLGLSVCLTTSRKPGFLIEETNNDHDTAL